MFCFILSVTCDFCGVQECLETEHRKFAECRTELDVVRSQASSTEAALKLSNQEVAHQVASSLLRTIKVYKAINRLEFQSK